jgi:hypothetical protein
VGRKRGLLACCIWSLDSQFGNRRAPAGGSLRPHPRNSHFAGTLGGDGFDLNCRPLVAVKLLPVSSSKRPVLGAVSRRTRD